MLTINSLVSSPRNRVCNTFIVTKPPMIYRNGVVGEIIFFLIFKNNLRLDDSMMLIGTTISETIGVIIHARINTSKLLDIFMSSEGNDIPSVNTIL